MKRRYLLLSGLALLTASAVQAQAKLVEKVTKQGTELVIPYEKYVLPNGLTLIVHEDHSDPVVHVDVTYHVGSAREEIGKSGFAHFFEHMMFQGSDNVADEQHFKIITEAGGTLNGTTNTDRTNYFETVPSNQLEKMLWLEADRMGFLLDAVTQQKFEVQRATVKNERGQRVDNVPYGLAGEVIAQNLYPYGHPYSWLTIGYVEDLDRVNVNDLKNFFLRWYGPNNAVVTVGGDVKPAEVVKLVEKYFGSIPAGPKVQNMAKVVPTLDKHRFASYTDNYARLPLLIRTYPTVPAYDADQAPLACLAQIIGQGNNSILYQELVKKQLALQASCFSGLSELSGTFTFQIVPFPGKPLSNMYFLLDQALLEFEKRGVTDDDIAKFKGGYESQLINGLQAVSGKVSQLAAFETFTGNPNMIGEMLKRYQAVTKEDVMRVYNKYIKHHHSLNVSVLPKGQDAKMLIADNNYTVDKSKYVAPDYGYDGLKYVKAKDNFDRTKMPGNGPNPVVNVPAFWKKDWPSGIKLIGTENNELPTVTLSVKIPGGHLMNTGNLSKAGQASFFTDMMNDDTKNYTAEQISRELQKLGSSISVFSGTEDITFQVQTQKKNLDATLALLQERMFNPKFTQEAFNRIQKRTLESFKIAKTQPTNVADEVFAKLNYGHNHILATDASGTEESVKNMTLADIQAYYDNYMTSQGTQVVVVGDITEGEILPKLNFLNNLPNKKITIPAVAATPKVEKTKVYLVDVPKAAQTEFRVGYTTGLKYDATGEYYKAGLMNYTLGGAFNSRLNLNLREDKGWTYGARSGFSGGKQTGDFEFSAGIKADATDSALVEIMKDMKEFADAGIKEDELSFLKNAIGQRDALRYETGFQKAGFIGNILNYNLPGDYVDQQSKITSGITKAEIDALAKKWINTDKMNILVVGDKAKILPGLQKLGYEIIELDTDGNPVQKKGF
ncbi:insulinase family protein [Nostoc ellipsosporum NOK]|jgi:zinc protease|nr:insulinase family protein [Nostoc ellipsosporum NOK]